MFSDGHLRPIRHHLDRRADRLIDEGSNGQPDDLISTVDMSAWLGVSEQWLEIGRTRGYGPTFIRVDTRRVRYRRQDVLEWLAARTYQCTSEYSDCPEQLVAARDAGGETQS